METEVKFEHYIAADEFDNEGRVCPIPGCGTHLDSPRQDLCYYHYKLYSPRKKYEPWLKDLIKQGRQYQDRERKRKAAHPSGTFGRVDKLEDTEGGRVNDDKIDKSIDTPDESAPHVPGLRAYTQQAIDQAADPWKHDEDTLRHLKPEEKLDECNRNIAFEETIDSLPTDDEKAIFWLYAKSFTQTKIAEMRGISQQDVSRSLVKIRKTIKSKVEQSNKDTTQGESEPGGRKILTGQKVPKGFIEKSHRTATNPLGKSQDYFPYIYVDTTQGVWQMNNNFDGFTELMAKMDTAKGEETLTLAQKAKVRANTLLLAAKWNEQTSQFELAQEIRIRAHTLLLAAQMLELEHVVEQQTVTINRPIPGEI